MTISNRSKLSLAQFLSVISTGELDILLEKYGAAPDTLKFRSPTEHLSILRDWTIGAIHQPLIDLINELARTANTIRSAITPRYIFDQRWQELCSCLELDGYRIDDNKVINIEPSIEGVVSVSDDLAEALARSGLHEASDIQRMIDLSVEHFVKEQPDYNACLNSARIALQTLSTAIAACAPGIAQSKHIRTSWGQTVAFLRTQGLIGPAEEAGLTGVFSLISPGSHRVIGLSEREFSRLGRSLATSMTFFLVRRFNALSGM